MLDSLHGRWRRRVSFTARRVDQLLKLRNPLQADRNLMRPTIAPSLIEAVAANLKHAPGVRLAELARIYLPNGQDELPDEIEIAAIAIAGRAEAGLYETGRGLDFFDLKGVSLICSFNGSASTPRSWRRATPRCIPAARRRSWPAIAGSACSASCIRPWRRRSASTRIAWPWRSWI